MYFYIKQNSTSPDLTYSIAQRTLDKYSISEDMLKYAVATFSMVDSDSKLYQVANNPAELIINTDPIKISKEGKYVLRYSFLKYDTETPGNYWGEFKIDILHPEKFYRKLTIPTSGFINIIISPSITKTTVIG